MKKRNYVVAVLVLFGALVGSPTLLSQSRPLLTRTALSKMDVLSRAELYERTIVEAARKEGVDPLILWTIAYNETRFRPWLTSPKDARGLMQFIPATASRYGLTDPYEPNASIHAAARYVKYLDGLFDGKIESVLAAYNSGEGTVLAYLHGRPLAANGKRINANRQRTTHGIPPYKETIHYVASGTRIYRWLQTQGKFPGAKKYRNSPLDAATIAVAAKQESETQGDSSKAPAIIVLYDPRSGNRYLADRGELRSIERSGAVIISTEVRGLITPKARSTFAGIPR